MDAANVDLKAFTEASYHRLCFAQLQPVLDTLKYLRHETNVWFEVTTLLIPGENDSDDELHRASEWFAENLGPNVPWHFTAFHPDFKMLEKPHTPAATLTRARKIARSKGFHTFTPETCMIAKEAAPGVPVAASYSSNAIGTSSACGILKTADVSFAVATSRAFSRRNAAIGGRGVCR